MRMSEFELLSRKDQIAILYQEGIYIGKRKTTKFIRLLFQLDSFYVEIIYISYRLSIHKMRYSDSITILDPYLEQIEVEYLVT
jgi:hypothetical protein